jgi:hypothetical protein
LPEVADLCSRLLRLAVGSYDVCRLGPRSAQSFFAVPEVCPNWLSSSLGEYELPEICLRRRRHALGGGFGVL